ncbi:MAG: DEAD/DEAH box helicase, partial [Thermodesulfovibrionales bacterium]
MNIKKKISESLEPAAEGNEGIIGGVKGSGIAAIATLLKGPLLVAVENENDAEILKNDILFYRTFLGGGPVEVLPYPSEVYQSGQRAKVLCHITDVQKIISYPEALLYPAKSPEGTDEYALTLKNGQEIEREMLVQEFREMGYHEVPVVGQKGEFSLRNWVIDVFPSTEANPLRIEFFGDIIDSLRYFRIDTQRSTTRIKDFALYPARDIGGGEDGTSFIETQRDERALLDVEGVLQNKGWDGDTIMVTFISDQDDEPVFKSIAGKDILYEERRSIEDIPHALHKIGEDVLIILPNAYQAKRVSELFEQQDMYVPVLQPDENMTYSGGIVINVGSLSEGLYIDGLMILTQKELFGKDIVLTRRLDSGGERFLDSFEDINKGDYIVHRDHGIGKFGKLDRYKVDESDIDVAVIEYANDSILYMPLYNIHKIDKYRAGEGVVPVVDSIGGQTWGRKERSVKKKIDRMVKKILDLYARREVARGFSFSSDTEVHREFYSFFPYEETADQIKVINEIFHDMESGKVMDRLLCGDVGFGKTEVAMRSVFKTVYDGRQVAVIVPTTVLCEQHYRNFKERFSAFPVSIDFISRFKSASQIRDTIERLEKGEIDIVIATHALLKRNVEFSDLGLMVIDEEHRFGVAQKEQIKELKKGVDCLMMSATPIPRTLQMAMSGIREMSIIETPPEERLSVKTTVARFDKNLIRDAVKREIARGGQVFFVHNRIKDINRIKEFLERLLPDIKIIYAHGQMRTRELEDVMVGFMKHDFDLLLCTSIIGSGIDIPAANTIFINIADRFGLADLYQLKGRVGRSS